MSLEQSQLTLGFIALSDCAPLAVAKEKGFFAAEGLRVSLSREASWANVRDRLGAGLLDGAHMLGPMAVAQSLGVGSDPAAIVAPMALNFNGSAITVSTAVAEALRRIDPEGMERRPRSADSLRQLAAQRRQQGLAPLTFAVVFPYSIHNYELRYWLAAGGMHPESDIRLVIVPPPRMVEKLRDGEIDGFSVGAPWNAVAVTRGLGEIMIESQQWWGAAPDKVLGVRRGWADRHPNTLQALLRALIRAGAWADVADHRAELASIVSRPEYVNVPEAIARIALAPSGSGQEGGGGDRLTFHNGATGFPWRSHALWSFSQMIRWGQARRTIDPDAAARVYEPDLYRLAAAAVGVAAPTIDLKVEGAHVGAWTLSAATRPIAMAPDAFFDGRVFDPAALTDYANGFASAPPATTV